MAMAAAAEALQSSKLLTADKPLAVPLDRIAVNFGMGMPGLPEVSDASWHLYNESNFQYNKIAPYFVPKVLGNTIAGAIAIKHGFTGPSHASVTACATGAHCIGDATRWIQHGDADVVVCGAAEACITPISIAGFCRMKALATKFNDDAAAASRPFDVSRSGFVMGEGAGALVLQTLESALSSGAPILAEVKGYGMSGDAFHVSSPHPEGRGVKQCVRSALRDAAMSPGDIGYVNAHATSTPMGDELELDALSQTLRSEEGTHSGGEGNGGSDTTNVPPAVVVSSTKGALGHLLGAAGAVEAIISIQSLVHSQAPGTANLTTPINHDESKVHLIREATMLNLNSQGEGPSSAVLSTSFGFGGTNAALVFAKHISD